MSGALTGVKKQPEGLDLMAMPTDMRISTIRIENGWVVRIVIGFVPSHTDPMAQRGTKRIRFCATRAEIIEFIDEVLEQEDISEEDPNEDR